MNDQTRFLKQLKAAAGRAEVDDYLNSWTSRPRVTKLFSGKPYRGTVASYDPKYNLVMVEYDDGDSEEFFPDELLALFRRSIYSQFKSELRSLRDNRSKIGLGGVVMCEWKDGIFHEATIVRQVSTNFVRVRFKEDSDRTYDIRFDGRDTPTDRARTILIRVVLDPAEPIVYEPVEPTEEPPQKPPRIRTAAQAMRDMQWRRERRHIRCL